MTLLLRMRNEMSMSQMQVGKMAAVGQMQELVAKDIDLDATNPPLAATKSGELTHLDGPQASTGNSRPDVVGNDAICSSNGDGGALLASKACSAVTADDGTCVTSVAQCNHLGESDSSAAKPSPSPPPSAAAAAAISSVCTATNSIADADPADRSCTAVTSADVNKTDRAAAVSERASVSAVSHTPEPSNATDKAVSTVDSETTLADVKDVVSSVQLTAPGSPHGVTVPSIRTNTVNMVVPAAVAPSATLRTLAPRIIVSTSPATTVLRVQTAAANVTAQPLPTVPSQQLILPVRNQGTAVPRVLSSFLKFC